MSKKAEIMQPIIIPILSILLYVMSTKQKIYMLDMILASLKSDMAYVTESIRNMDEKAKKKWRTYYRLLSEINYPYLRMYDGLLRYIIKYIQPIRIYVAIDDSFIFRSRSKKVPTGHFDYDHARKSNRSKYVWGQNLMAVTFSIAYGDNKLLKIPFRIKLKSDAMSKIHYGRYMMKSTIAFLAQLRLLKNAIVSFDSWFTNYPMIAEFAPFVTIVAQAKLNYVFYHLPADRSTLPKRRGAPKKYGDRIYKPNINSLEHKVTLHLYNKEMKIEYSDFIVKARFLKGMIIKIVYLKFPDAKKLRVLLSTDINLSAVEIIEAYEKRWKIEMFFYEYKHVLGLKDMMQHSLQTYYRWGYIRLISYTIINFLKTFNEKEIASFTALTFPWRTTNKKKKISITFKVAQLYFFSFFSSFDKRYLLHETLNNSSAFLRSRHQPLNNRGYKHREFVDFLLDSG